MEIVHRFLGAIIIFLGILLILLAEMVPADSLVIRGFLSNAGTSLLALGIIEIIFKTYLQKDLIDNVVSLLKKAISQPFDAVYLRRSELPVERDLPQILRKSKSIVYLKAISYSGVTGIGLLRSFNDVLTEGNIEIRILIFDPEASALDKVAELAGLTPTKLQGDIREVIGKINGLRRKPGARISCRLYDSVPTCAIILVDPDTPGGILRIEPYLYIGQPGSNRINLFLSKRQDQAYFSEVFNAIKTEWDHAVEGFRETA